MAGSLAQLLTNQVLIEMAIQLELVTVPVVNVNLTQPIRRTRKRSSRGSRSRIAHAPPDHPKTMEERYIPFGGGGWLVGGHTSRSRFGYSSAKHKKCVGQARGAERERGVLTVSSEGGRA